LEGFRLRLLKPPAFALLAPVLMPTKRSVDALSIETVTWNDITGGVLMSVKAWPLRPYAIEDDERG
jgi:hypothetical protein